MALLPNQLGSSDLLGGEAVDTLPGGETIVTAENVATATGTPSIYWFQGNQIVLYPAPSGAPVLRVYFSNRPSTLVAASSCIQIADFAAGAAPSTLGAFRLGFTGAVPAGFVAGALIDLVQNRPGFDVLFTGRINAITATTVDFIGTSPVALQVGDWICLSDTAPVVTGAIPDLLVGCLVKKVALEIASAKSDDAAYRRLRDQLSEAEERARQFLQRRNSGERPKAGMFAFSKFKRVWGF